MCGRWGGDVCMGMADMEDDDEQTWKKLGPVLVEHGQNAEFDRCKQMGVYEFVPQDDARTYQSGKAAKVKRARLTTGSDEGLDVRCRLMAQELDHGERMGEFAAGTSSLTIVKLLSEAAERDLTIMLVDAICALQEDLQTQEGHVCGLGVHLTCGCRW